MALEQKLVCDVCGEPAVTVTIIIDETAWNVDLCVAHRAPVSDVLIHARESRLPSRTRGAYEKVTPEHLHEIIKRAEEEAKT